MLKFGPRADIDVAASHKAVLLRVRWLMRACNFRTFFNYLPFLLTAEDSFEL